MAGIRRRFIRPVQFRQEKGKAVTEGRKAAIMLPKDTFDDRSRPIREGLRCSTGMGAGSKWKERPGDPDRSFASAVIDVFDQISFASATAVSDMRLEKPHSLSYQVRMRTKLPSRTFVWSSAKIEEWLSWLKSRETSGSSV